MLPLQPGEKGQLSWAVTSDNVDLGRFAFVHVVAFPAYPLKFREMTCGILVLGPGPLTGGQVVNIVLVASVLCLAGGLALWSASRGPVQGRRATTAGAMRFLALVVLGAMLASLLGAWAVGIALVAIALLMILAMTAATSRMLFSD